MLSEDVKMHMYLQNAKRYYALNDRTINLLMEGNVDMGATTGETGEGDKGTFSDAGVMEIAKKEKEVELFTAEKQDKSRWIILPIS